MFDNRGAHCACAAPRARPSPAPPAKARRPGAGVREPTRRPEAARTRGSRSGRPGSGPPATRRHGGPALRGPAATSTPSHPPPPVSCSLFSWSRGPSFRHLPLAVGEKGDGGARGHLESLFFAAALLPPAARMKFSRPRLEAWNLHRQGFLLHVSCLCCADGNFRNMPPSRRGRKRLAQSSEAPLVSGLPGPGAVCLGFPLSAPGSYST